jgi:hypothetical protein
MRRNVQLIANNPDLTPLMIQDLATDFQDAAKVIMSVRFYGVAAEAIKHAVGLMQ